MLVMCPAHASARMSATLAFLEDSAGHACVRVYSGARPASTADEPVGMLLVEIVLAKPAGAVSGVSLALQQQEDGLIIETGVATWVRVLTAAGVIAMDMDCGDIDSQAEIKLPSLNLLAGGSARLMGATLS